MNPSPFSVLFISNDPAMLDAGSAVRIRMRAYAYAIGTLHILTRCTAAYQGPDDIQDGTLFLHAVRGSKLLALAHMVGRAKKIILENKIDVVSAQDPFEYGLIAARAVKKSGTPLHIQIHTDFLSPWFTRSGVTRSPRTRMSSLNRIRQKIADRVLPQAQAIRVVSERIRDSVVTNYAERVPVPVVIPIQVSGTLPPKVDLPEHPFTFVLMAIGRLEPEKRIEDLLVMLSRLKDKYRGLGLMIVGDGRERARLEEWAQTLGIQERVQFLGTRPDAFGLLQNANAFVQASAYEGYGITLVEAALARVPIITTDVGIIGEVFRGYEEVLATPPGDPANLAALVSGILEDTAARHQYVAKAEIAAKAHLAAVHTEPVDIAADLRAAFQSVIQK